MKRKTGMNLTAAALLLSAVTLTGCGSGSEAAKDGMDKIAALDYQGALDGFNRALEEGGDKEQILRGMGMAYMGLSRYDEAVSSFEEALANGRMFPGDLEADINYYLALAQYKSEQKEEAVKTLDAVAAMNKKSPEVYFLRGSIKMETGVQQEATEDLNLALHYSEQDTAMTIRVYQVFEKNGYKEEGRNYLSSAIDARLNDMSEYEKGVIYYYMEDYENARNNLEAYRAQGNNDTDTLLMLGKTYEQLGDSNYAASLYKKYLEENEADAEIFNQLGLCRLQTGQYEEALAAFEGGLEAPNSAGVLQKLKYNRIVAYEYSGDFQKASAMMGEYIQEFPDDADALREYEFLRSR
ncbi:MAG: tetratricopeptide repeat protein [Lachnospiraceae bacterium]|nr:tetratricopeptide repeat protein [Lachnospiraceae bacterium]